MFAFLIGYNAFYIAEPNKIISSSITSSYVDEKYEEDENLKININIASEFELLSLDGIGPSKAKNIIEYRETHGGFSSIEEIMNVKGIGEKIFKNIKDNICI